MKRSNVYKEELYLILGIIFFLGFASFFIVFCINNFHYVYFLISALFFVFTVFFFLLGLPNTIRYIKCKNSKVEIDAVVVDKYIMHSRFNFKEKYIIVLEYKINKASYRSLNKVDKEIAEGLELKNKVKAKLFDVFALYTATDGSLH